MDEEYGIVDPFSGREHDHARCIANALGAAATLCRQRGRRLTPLRERVLELVWQSHAPVGAYEVLDRLLAERRSAAPPTVYRALDFLCEQGLVHRVQSLNAFVGCAFPGDRHRAHFLICHGCGAASEIEDAAIAGAVARAARRAGFAVEHETVELRGLCGCCRTG